MFIYNILTFVYSVCTQDEKTAILPNSYVHPLFLYISNIHQKKSAILPFLVAFGKPHRVIGGFDKRGYSEQARKDKRFSKLLEQIVLDNDFKETIVDRS